MVAWMGEGLSLRRRMAMGEKHGIKSNEEQ